MLEEKVCADCGVLKPASDYYRRRGGRYLRAECKICNAARTKLYRDAHPEKRAAYDRKHMYGLTREQHDDLLVRAGGRCEICGVEGWPGRNPGTPTVDHRHGTRQVRGLLCGNCNVALGMMNDNLVTLASAIAYLGTHGAALADAAAEEAS